MAPARLVDLLDIAAGNGAGVVDENIDVGEIARQAARRVALAQIERDDRDGDIVLRADLLARRGQIGGGARHQHEVAAFRRQRARGGAADALRSAGDERLAAAEIEVHRIPPMLLRAAPTMRQNRRACHIAGR